MSDEKRWIFITVFPDSIEAVRSLPGFKETYNYWPKLGDPDVLENELGRVENVRYLYENPERLRVRFIEA